MKELERAIREYLSDPTALICYYDTGYLLNKGGYGRGLLPAGVDYVPKREGEGYIARLFGVEPRQVREIFEKVADEMADVERSLKLVFHPMSSEYEVKFCIDDLPNCERYLSLLEEKIKRKVAERDSQWLLRFGKSAGFELSGERFSPDSFAFRSLAGVFFTWAVGSLQFSDDSEEAVRTILSIADAAERHYAENKAAFRQSMAKLFGAMNFAHAVGFQGVKEVFTSVFDVLERRGQLAGLAMTQALGLFLSLCREDVGMFASRAQRMRLIAHRSGIDSVMLIYEMALEAMDSHIGFRSSFTPSERKAVFDVVRLCAERMLQFTEKKRGIEANVKVREMASKYGEVTRTWVDEIIRVATEKRADTRQFRRQRKKFKEAYEQVRGLFDVCH